MDNCIGINNRRYYLMLWSTMTLLMAMAIYPLGLLDSRPAAVMSSDDDQPPQGMSLEVRVLAATQLVSAAFGLVLSFVYT